MTDIEMSNVSKHELTNREIYFKCYIVLTISIVIGRLFLGYFPRFV